MAARRPRAAGRANATHRYTSACIGGGFAISDLGRGLPASAGAIGMDDWTQCADRHPLGRRQRQYHPKTRGGVGRARAEAIFAHDNAAVGALQQISRTVPIVFPVIGDPVAAGFIDSLARPGGNATGFMNFEFALSSKWLETIKQIAPGATRVAVLRDPAVGSGTTQFAVIQAAAPTMGMEATPVNMREAGEIAHSIESFAAARDGGLIVTAGAATYRHRNSCS